MDADWRVSVSDFNMVKNHGNKLEQLKVNTVWSPNYRFLRYRFLMVLTSVTRVHPSTPLLTLETEVSRMGLDAASTESLQRFPQESWCVQTVGLSSKTCLFEIHHFAHAAYAAYLCCHLNSCGTPASTHPGSRDAGSCTKSLNHGNQKWRKFPSFRWVWFQGFCLYVQFIWLRMIVLMHPRSGLVRGAALPAGAFFSEMIWFHKIINFYAFQLIFYQQGPKWLSTRRTIHKTDILDPAKFWWVT